MKRSLLVVLLSLMLIINLTACNSSVETVQQEVKKGVENVILSDVNTSDKVEEDVDKVSTLENIQVYFIDVGQADSTLIVTPNKDAILIDAGEKGDVDTIISQIRESGVEDLDLVVATHPHADHIGGMQEVIEKYDAREILMSSYITTTKTFENLLDTIEKQGKGITQAKKGLKREIDGVKIEVLGVDIIPDDSNNSSIVLKVEYGDVSLLFTGDLESDAEKILIANGADLSADILQVGHHGSETSTSEEFLSSVNPKLAVISVGENNKYNHPSKSIIDRLMNNGISFYRTDEDGTIELEIDGINIVTVLSNTIQEVRPKTLNSLLDMSVSIQCGRGKIKKLVEEPLEIAKVELLEEVYIVEGDPHYHTKDCELLHGSTKTISIEEAKAKGLTKCNACYK